METAVKVLSQMKEAKAAKVLAEMSDPALAAQMVEKLRGVKRNTPVTTTPGG
jgi:flagellar motility protein MotE (MotC chaperone)